MIRCHACEYTSNLSTIPKKTLQKKTVSLDTIKPHWAKSDEEQDRAVKAAGGEGISRVRDTYGGEAK